MGETQNPHTYDTSKVPKFGVRHVQMLFASSILFIAMGMRGQFTIGVVAMTEPNTSPNPDIPVYNWTNKGIILSSFFWGYIVLQTPAGNLARLYGTKYVLMGSMAANSIILLFTPLITQQYGSYGIIVCNVINGLAQGFYFPCIYFVFAKWCPPLERGTLNSMAIAGAPLGTIVGMPVLGFLASTWGGWPVAFYVYGGLGLLWVVAHFFFGASSPTSCRYISEEEKKYLLHFEHEEKKHASIPWKGILMNMAFWALFLNHVGNIWTYITLVSEIPTYINKIMKFNIKSNSLLSSAPYVANFLLTMFFGRLVDFIMRRKLMTLTNIRKLFTAIAMFGPTITLLTLGFLPADQIALSVVLLILTVGSNSACSVGASVNFVDLTPNFAGILYGLINSIAHFAAIFGPTLVHVIVKDESDKSQWLTIFIITSMVFFVPGVLYMFFGSAEVQPFDLIQDKKKEEEDPSLQAMI